MSTIIKPIHYYISKETEINLTEDLITSYDYKICSEIDGLLSVQFKSKTNPDQPEINCSFIKKNYEQTKNEKESEAFSADFTNKFYFDTIMYNIKKELFKIKNDLLNLAVYLQNNNNNADCLSSTINKLLLFKENYLDKVKIEPIIEIDEGIKKTFEDLLTYSNATLKYTIQKADFYEQEGIVNINQQRFNEAVDCFDKAIELFPRNYEYFLNKGIALIGLEKYDEAKTNLNISISINPNCVLTYLIKAKCYRFEYKHELALKIINKALKLDPYNVNVLALKADILASEEEEFEQAVYIINKITKINPYNVSAYSNKAWCLRKLYRYEDSLFCLNRIFALKKINLDTKEARKNIIDQR